MDGASVFSAAVSGESGLIDFPAEPRPTVSIVVYLRDSAQRANQCLQALAAHTAGVPYEVVIAVDDTFAGAGELASRVRNAQIVADSSQPGFAGHCASAARHTHGELLVFVDESVTVSPQWLRPLVDVFERRSDAGLVGPKLLDPAGRVVASGRIVWRDGSYADYGSGDDPGLSDFNYLKEVDSLPGQCLMVSTEAWEAAGGFDLEMPPSHRDVDLAMTVRSSGRAVVYQPLSVAVLDAPADLGVPAPATAAAGWNGFTSKWAAQLASGHNERGAHVFIARDRSAARTRVLVIDRQVPTYDRDAGSRLTFEYLRLFAELSYAVTLLVEDHTRREPYSTELEQLGIQAVSDGYMREGYPEWLRRFGPYFDHVYVHRPLTAAHYLASIRSTMPTTPVVYLAHDLHHIREGRRFEMTGDLEALALSVEYKSIEEEVLSHVDVVHVLSTFEEQVVRDSFPDLPVRRLPALQTVRADDPAPFDERSDLLFVANYSHAPNADAACWFAEQVLPRFWEREPEARFFVVGARPPESLQAIAGDRVVVTGGVSDDDLEAFYARCRLAVAPLRYGAGLKIKVVEAMARGVPVVATPAAAEGLPAIDGALVVAHDPEPFAEGLAAVYSDEAAWTKLSKSARAYVDEHFSRQRAVETILIDFPPRPPLPPTAATNPSAGPPAS